MGNFAENLKGNRFRPLPDFGGHFEKRPLFEISRIDNLRISHNASGMGANIRELVT